MEKGEGDKVMEIVHKASGKIKHELANIIKGQDEFLDMLLVCLFTGGHVIIEGVPGMGKTLTARVLAKASDLDFKRIQFTPDMMPSDVTGNNIFDLNEGRFHFKKGPVFTNILLADEINRTPPRTQSALLEAMEEKSVTIYGERYPLDEPFMVLATQNPIEFEGTYPLPEAQLDRFLMKLKLEYPDEASEYEILNSYINGFNAADIESMEIPAVIQRAELIECRKAVSQVKVSEDIMKYIISIIRATRSSPVLMLGASPRAAVSLMLASRALAAINNRDFVIPDDVKALSKPVLGHRLILTPEAEMDGITAEKAIHTIVEGIKVPR